MTEETAIVKQEQQKPVLSVVQAGWTRKQIELLKRTYAKGATDDELMLFKHQCERTGLDPFNKQIHFIKYKDGSVHFHTAIDGFRSLADKTGLYVGNDDYRYDDGLTEYEHIKAGRGNHPETATATVYKLLNGERIAFSATARWGEYFVSTSPLWRKMPYLMLGKCAESLALRKAFPKELGGLYTHDEMMQAEKNTLNYKTGEIKELMETDDTPFDKGGKGAPKEEKKNVVVQDPIPTPGNPNRDVNATVDKVADAFDGEVAEEDPSTEFNPEDYEDYEDYEESPTNGGMWTVSSASPSYDIGKLYKDDLKARGYQWNPSAKTWDLVGVTKEKADEEYAFFKTTLLKRSDKIPMPEIFQEGVPL